MARVPKTVEADAPEGAPEWMVTFSDCMTLLLTFFVLLLSFSSFDDVNEAKYKKMTDSLAQQFSFNTAKAKEEEAVFAVENIVTPQSPRKGSEQPTPETRLKKNLKSQTEPEKFRDQKVFLIPSDRIFWGQGTLISLLGRGQLETLADYLKKMRHRVVITESGGDGTAPPDLGLRRAWVIVDYLAVEQGMDRDLFSISASGTVPRGALPPTAAQAERTLEIVLLERRLYN